MELELRHHLVGLIAGLGAFVAYWAIILNRAATDDVAFTEVAWRGPLLLVLGVGGGLYAVIYILSAVRNRGRVVTDVRDAEIRRAAEEAGAGLTGIASLTALILLGLDVSTFWVAHVLFVGGFLGSLAYSGKAITAYRKGLA